jgi:FkbM family methyltransferase
MKLAFDIGSYIGQYVSIFKNLGFDEIVCVEPSNVSFQNLSGIFQHDKTIHLVNKAVHDVDGIQLPLLTNSTLPILNTLHGDWLIDTRHVVFGSDVSILNMIESVTLDSLIKTYGVPSHIKIDVEGHELSVLKGLTQRIDMISFEWISELDEKNIECASRCYDLGSYKFYVTFAEIMPHFIDIDPNYSVSYEEEFILKPEDFGKYYKKEFYNIDEITEFFKEIKQKDNKNCIWGNLWCQSTEDIYYNRYQSKPYF